MLCPEVQHFKAPRTNFKIEKGDLQRVNQKDTFVKINNFHHNHLVSVVIPDTLKVPQSLSESLVNDCEYYKIDNINIAELFDATFVDNFVKKGNLTGLSINKRIDCDNCVAVTPNRKLILSLTKETYQTLGLEGKLSHFAKRTRNRYIVSLDLNLEQYKAGTKTHNRTKQCLQNLQNYSMIFTWQPDDETICPSSLAKYFDDLKYNVSLCKPQHSIKNNFGLNVPVINFKDFEAEDVWDVLEWIGMVGIGGDLKEGTHDGFLNTYTTPEPNQHYGQVKYMEWRGLFTSQQILLLFQELRKFISNEMKPWGALYVQGFSDSPINWQENEHHFYTNGDNAWTILINPEGKYIIAKNECSNKRYK